ncbi:TRAP transporter large permease [Bacillus sp. DTU_2020_1000418_1_SI_GHA_SEK_038]|uniref:TRAP transporter large permease n=1 Tax=Bacillus sp. DTU_2020_1000418_1_SI_GHA_SEK_038 TaxID=3077585 RepID=UPI0028E4D1E3|nr:TRAP transporter large permease [Bacillus sp. DTU_2020_1000418_1_SI_GHA_SEK_038]WNS76650.1 TRAP transporter large permease [Bacillus sp. DTU_2020_1000418_1_SI_GHA_SEK_038]
MLSLVAILVLIVILLLGVEIPYAFFASILVIVVFGGYDYTFLLPYGFSKVSSLILVAIPLFILAGQLMEKSGIGESLINFVTMFIGRIKGGLGAVMVISCALFGSISGSGFATLSSIGTIMLPRMQAAGYPRGVSAALISSASLLGLLIPPSLNMILFAFIGGQSVLATFLSTIGPGILLIILLILTNWWMLRDCKTLVLPEKMEKPVFVNTLVNRTGKAVPALIAPFIILGGIYGGFLTPTEAAAVSVLYTIPIGILFYKGLDWKTFKSALVAAGTTAGVIMIMLLSVMMLSRLYIMENVPNMILDLMMAATDNRLVLIFMLNLFLIIIGMLMDDTSAILLTTPILLPVAIALEIHPVHFAAIMGVNLGLGCVTPPTAPFLYLGSRIGNAPINEMMKPTMWLILFAWLPTLFITTVFPDIALFLPRLFGLL